jgi:rifampicin phosphotransferase
LVQRYSVARENLKYCFVMAHARLRRCYLVLANQLVGETRLKDPESIFYLRHEEIALLLNSHMKPDEADKLIQLRRREYKRDQSLSGWPKILETLPDGRILPLTHPAAQAGSIPFHGQTAEVLLHGVAASAGFVSGRARVVLDPSETAHLEAGEILIARATNPAWAPLLLSAGALVTEIGGLLSHGAIVAREYGLPAVLNVPAATTRIRTGQLIQVDGFAGTVRIVEHGQME